MDIEKYIIKLEGIDSERLLIAWIWLTGKDKTTLVITKLGNVLLRDKSGVLFLLNTEEGSFETLSNYYADFYNNKLSAEQYFEIFQPELIKDLEGEGKVLKEGQVYSYSKLPMHGRTIGMKSRHSSNVYEHFDKTGVIHKQLSDLIEEQRLNQM